MKIIVGIIILVLLIWGVGMLLKKDTYVGFYYPNASNLTNDIQSDSIFNSLEACRDWVDEQASVHNPNDTNYNYECGKNCDLSGSKPYICEETLE